MPLPRAEAHPAGAPFREAFAPDCREGGQQVSQGCGRGGRPWLLSLDSIWGPARQGHKGPALPDPVMLLPPTSLLPATALGAVIQAYLSPLLHAALALHERWSQ